MGKFVAFYVAFTSLVVIAYLSLISRYYLFCLLMLIAPAIYFYRKRPAPVKSNNYGLFLGKGLNIENPEKPKKIQVHLDLTLGFLAIGGPKSGKSIFAIVVLEYYTKELRCGWIYWDGKGDIDVYQQAVAVGVKPEKFFSIDLIQTDTVNLINGPTSGVIEAMTQALISGGNPFYEVVQREAIGAIVPLLKATGKKVTLRDVYVAIKFDEAAKYAIELANENGADKSIIAVAADYISTPRSDRDQGSKGLLTKMSLFVTGDVAERLNAYNPTLDLIDSAKKGERVYMHLPSSAIARDVSIFFTETIGVIAKNRQLYDRSRVMYPMVFDDWGGFFYDNIGSITARCRSALMPVSYLFQSKGQTDAVENSKIFTTVITDNIGGFFSFRINGNDTSKWVADQFGHFDSKEINANGDIVTVEKPLVRSDQIKNLNAGECYLDTLKSGDGGVSDNIRIKTRVPMPDIYGYEAIDWPEFKVQPKGDESDCLNFWNTFMDAENMKELQKELKAKAQKEAQQIDDTEEIHHL